MTAITSDFSGVLVAPAPDATPANNAAGVLVTVQSNHFLSLGSTSVGGSLAQNEPIAIEPLFPHRNKVIKNAPKTASEAWAVGQTLYIIDATNIYTTTAGSNLVAGVAASVAASAAVVGDVLPSIPNAA